MLRNPIILAITARIANTLLKLLFFTCRVSVKGLEHLDGNQKLVLMAWHNRIIMLPQILIRHTKKQHFAAFVSNSRDGALLAALVSCHTRGSTIRVPHDMRSEALRKAIKQIRDTDDVVIITPDGPRGPRYQVKGGIALAAKGAKAVVVPMSWKSDRTWELNTWDRMMIPKPFSKISVEFGAPVTLSEGSIEERSAELQVRLNALS